MGREGRLEASLARKLTDEDFVRKRERERERGRQRERDLYIYMYMCVYVFSLHQKIPLCRY